MEQILEENHSPTAKRKKNDPASSGNPSESLLYFAYEGGSRKNRLPQILPSSLLYFGGDQLRINSLLIPTLLPPRNPVESNIIFF
jgi:hypothetical protein